MKRTAKSVCGMQKPLSGAVLGLLLWALSLGNAPAQLAITEVMASENLFNQLQGSDFWELTNFGTNTIDLTGYMFTDPNHPLPYPLPADGLIIQPGQSIVFFRTNGNAVLTENDFRQWWGLATNRPVVRAFRAPGLSSQGDKLRLFDSSSNLVDAVDFGATESNGVSFTYDPITGEFGVPSRVGYGGAFESPFTHSIGSPGIVSGSVALRIVTQPTNLFLIPGMDASFLAEAAGMPPPKFQWMHDGVPIAGGTMSTLTVPDAQPVDSGSYGAIITNGLEQITSASATLTLLTNPCSPFFVTFPSHYTICANATGRFHTVVAGWPRPQLQWLCDGTPLPGETNRDLNVPDAAPFMSGQVYCLIASNWLSSTSACAALLVSGEGSHLQITEVMPRQTPERKDWFEVTNFGTNAVNLEGYRYSQAWDLQGARVVDRSVIIRPGESAVFAELLTREEFVAWWGADNLPEGLQVITWKGFGLSPSDVEHICLWGPITLEVICTEDDVYTRPVPKGISLYYDKPAANWTGLESVVGDRGAFTAANGGEVGSPGYIAAPDLKIFSVAPNIDGVVIKGRSVPGRQYALLTKDRLSDAVWTELTAQIATNAAVVFHDKPTGTRFYTLIQK